MEFWGFLAWGVGEYALHIINIVNQIFGDKKGSSHEECSKYFSSSSRDMIGLYFPASQS